MKRNIIVNKYKKPSCVYIGEDIIDMNFLLKLKESKDYNIDMTIKERIEYLKIMHKNKNSEKLFKFDEKFAKFANNYEKEPNICDYYYTTGIMNNMVVHRSQIDFYYKNCEYYDYNDNIYVKYKDKSYLLCDFVKTHLYEREDFTDCIEILESDNILDNDFCIMLHVGYENIGEEIIDNIILKKINNYANIIVSFNEEIDAKNITQKIKNNFINYTIIKTKNFGNDIAPFILISEKITNLANKIILKLHTKYDDQWRSNILDLFLDNKLKELLNIIQNNKQISSIGNFDYLVNYKDDKHNKVIIKKILKNITEKDNFFAGTMFLFRFNKEIHQKLKQLKKSILFLPYYYDNALFWSRSPVHCAERIFGYIAKDEFKYNLGIEKYKFTTKCCIYASHIKNEDDVKLIRCNIKLLVKNLNKIYFVYSSDVGFCNIYENPNIDYIKVNNVGLDLAKYHYGLSKIKEKYDWYILINDSITFIREIYDLFFVLNYCEKYDFVGLIDSHEVKYHYQSFFWCLQENIKDIIIEKFKNVFNMDKNELIYNCEIKFSNKIINAYETLSLFKFGYFDKEIEKKYIGSNPNFLTKLGEFIEATNYPIMKVKLLLCKCIFPELLKLKNIKSQFDWKTYAHFNKDLPAHFGEKEYTKHFYEQGYFEDRIYSADLYNEQKKFIFNIIEIIKLPEIKNIVCEKIDQKYVI